MFRGTALAHWVSLTGFTWAEHQPSCQCNALSSTEQHWAAVSLNNPRQCTEKHRVSTILVSAMHWAALSPRQCTEKHWAALSNVPIVLSLRCHSHCHRTFHRLVRATICEMFQFTSTVATGTLPYCTRLLNTLVWLPVYEDLDLTVFPPDLSHRLRSQLLDARALWLLVSRQLTCQKTSSQLTHQWPDKGIPQSSNYFIVKNLDLSVSCQNSCLYVSLQVLLPTPPPLADHQKV